METKGGRLWYWSLRPAVVLGAVAVMNAATGILQVARKGAVTAHAYIQYLSLQAARDSRSVITTVVDKLPAMDMEDWSGLCLTALSTILILCFYKFSGGGKGKPKKQLLPPGPWTLPIIGSLHHVLSKLPHRRMMELSRLHGPLMYLKLGEVPAVVVSSAEAASLVMKTHDVDFASRRSSATVDIISCGGKDVIFAPYGDHWRQMRKICVMELLNAKQVSRMEGIRAEEVGNLLRSVRGSNGATINVSEKMAALSNSVVTRAVFGGKFTQQENYLRELQETFALVAGFSLVDLFPSSRLVRWLSNTEGDMRRSYGRIQRIIADIIDECKAAQDVGDGACRTDDEDLLEVLLRLQLEDSFEFPLTAEVIGAVLFDIFAAATDTTATLLAWALSELVNNPEVMAKAQLEIREVLGSHKVFITTGDLNKLQYMRMVIKEVLRLHPPAPLPTRVARKDCKIMGYDMFRGTTLYVNVFAISRDARYWENPEDFKPERFQSSDIDYKGTDFEFLPFGSGRWKCPGMLFGTSTAELVLANLIYHFDWKLPDGAGMASFDMSEKFGLTVSRKNDLQLKAIPYAFSKPIRTK